MKLNHGVFTISLDFELYWGVRDKRSIDQYQDHLQGVRNAVAEMLRVFGENHIHATWATVGFLFLNDTQDLKRNRPAIQPEYKKQKLCPYRYIRESDELEPAYHFAPDLIKLILEHQGQEIGTHTFSHYYCLEDGQSQEQFATDISTAIEVANRHRVTIRSLVFPRNQWNANYLPALTQFGVQCYRGNETSWIYKATDGEGQNKLRRALRLIDAYFCIFGHNTYQLSDCVQEQPFNFPASRFLRPYSRRLAFLDQLRLRRIKKAMNYAAANNEVFHLWWHPHNFGTNTNQNIAFLTKIVEHFNLLKNTHGMMSMNMGDLCRFSGAQDES